MGYVLKVHRLQAISIFNESLNVYARQGVFIEKKLLEKHSFIIEYIKKNIEITKKVLSLIKTNHRWIKFWHNMVIVHFYNVQLISIQFLPFIFGHFDGDIGAQTVSDPDTF